MSAPVDSALFLSLLDGSGQPDAARPPAELPRKGKLIVGCSTERADFVVTGQGIADVHCAIGRLKTGGWALKDLGSSFGTLLNGERVETARLQPGDELLIGSRKIRIVADTSAGSPAREPAAAPAKISAEPMSSPRPTAPTRGAVSIAGYRIESELGRGAMGRVLRATQTSLDRKVAVKVLAPKLAGNATFVERFRKEARAAAQLNHPNVVTVFDVGEDGGQHFLSMEYMDGGSVETHLSTKGRFHWREALGVLRDAAAGLVYAEARGIVHRDIKPDNLMRNAEGVTKIADLGLAVQVEQAHVDGERGKVFGTPHFLAPELARGATPDARSDIYSLGATAYRMISGRTPHEGTDPRSILRSVLQDSPPRLGQLVQGLPAEVDELVHGMLVKEPTERTASAGFVVRQIDGILSGAGETPVGSSKGRLIGIAAGVLVAAGLFVFLGGDGSEESGPPAARSGQESNARGASDLASPISSADPVSPPDPSTTSETPSDGAPAVPMDDGGSETAVEDLAKAALLALEGEALSASERSARLKELARKFAGTDTANQALSRATSLDSGAAEERGAAEAYAALRKGAIDDLTELADPRAEGIRPGEALARVAAFEPPPEILQDAEYRTARGELLDALLARISEISAAAESTAAEAQARGEFQETIEPLAAALDRCEFDEAIEALLAAEERPGLEGAREALAGLRARLAGLEGRRAEFDEVRQQRERALVGETLGRSFRAQLGSLQLAEAADGSRRAAGLIREEALRESVEETAEHLDTAGRALSALLDAWDEGEWRRRAVIDPRSDDAEFTDVVGIARPAALLLPGASGKPGRVPLGAWASDPGQMENLFLRRLDRSWSEDETVGIVTLLCVSGTIAGLEAIQPAISGEGKRLRPSQISAAQNAFDEARSWADGRTALLQLVERHAAPMRMLADAVVARERGDWLLSSELLNRLIEEERDSFVVMILSDGGAR